MSGAPYHSLRIRDLSLQVRIGCSREERRVPQEIRVGVELRFPLEPKGTESDDLEDTVCYAKISEEFQRHCAGQEFRLVERLTKDLFRIAQRLARRRAEMSVTVHKVRPPVDGLIGGAVFRIGDFP